jgi:hypothetical protein
MRFVPVKCFTEAGVKVASLRNQILVKILTKLKGIVKLPGSF